MTTLNDSDLFLVNRGGVDYKITAQELKEYLTAVPSPPMPWHGRDDVWHLRNLSAVTNIHHPTLEVENYDVIYDIEGNEIGVEDISKEDSVGEYIICGARARFGGPRQIELGPETNTSGITDFNNMFYKFQFRGDGGLKYIDASSGTDFTRMLMACMFEDLQASWDAIAKWDVSNGVTFEQMFHDADAPDTVDFSGWNMSKAENLQNMFASSEAKKLGISGWDVSNVTNFYGMFSGGELTNLDDLKAWDVNKVTNMDYMFYSNRIWGDLSNWVVPLITKRPDRFGMFSEHKPENEPCWNDCKDGTAVEQRQPFTELAFDGPIDCWDPSDKYIWVELSAITADQKASLLSLVGKKIHFRCVTVPYGDPEWWQDDSQGMPNGYYPNTNCTDLLETVLDVTEKAFSSGTFLRIEVENLLRYTRLYESEKCPATIKIEPTSGTSMPWEGHDGGVWHVKNLGQVPVLLGPAGSSFDSWTVDGSDQRSISQLEIGEERVIVSPPHQENMFGNEDKGRRNTNAEFEFGSYTDTSRVTNLEGCFTYCSKFNGSLGGNWDTSNVTNMAYLFNEAQAFNQDISGWNTSKVTSMYYMFFNDKYFVQDISGWDTSNVINMSTLFRYCEEFNADISNWDVSKVTDMMSMFTGAKKFNQDLSNWCVTNIEEPYYFDDNADAWTKPRPCWGHCPPKGDPCPQPVGLPWIGHEGGIWHIKNSNQQVRFYQGNYLLQEPCQAWKVDGTDLGLIHTMEAGEEIVFVTGADVKELFAGGIDQNGAAQKTANWDFGEHTDTSKVTSMHSLFEYCEAFNGELGGNWDTSNVTNMHSMFHNAWYFNQDISDWDVSNVLSFKMMFDRAESFNQDISKWNTGKCEKYAMDYMFNRAKAFNQNLTEWCVDFQTFEPVSFAWRTWSSYSQPKWGSCPRGESNA